ncbi:hypothetical protein Hanom_Chr05g00442141 [Helianthus anomalus]
MAKLKSRIPPIPSPPLAFVLIILSHRTHFILLPKTVLPQTNVLLMLSSFFIMALGAR